MKLGSFSNSLYSERTKQLAALSVNFEQIPLPFEANALEPFISQRTVDVHYSKHHAGYLRKLDAALQDERRELDLPELVCTTSGSLFNLAAQVWNHDFYWQSLSVEAQTPEDSGLSAELVRAFGGIDGFNSTFAQAAAREFGSGWAWLLWDPADEALQISSTTDAVNPMTSGQVPLLTLDVWEHAYYLDYQNRRGDYIQEFLKAHINWRFAEANWRAALG